MKKKKLFFKERERKDTPVVNNFLCSLMFNSFGRWERNWVKNEVKHMMTIITEFGMLMVSGGTSWWKDKKEIYRQIASESFHSNFYASLSENVKIGFLEQGKGKEGMRDEENKSKINLLTFAMEFSLRWKKPKKKPSHTRFPPAQKLLFFD